jgi:hypothetical protein
VLGHMSLKEKLRVVLNQKGQFKCPNGGHALVKPTGNEPAAQRLALVIGDLRKRGETALERSRHSVAPSARCFRRSSLNRRLAYWSTSCRLRASFL